VPEQNHGYIGGGGPRALLSPPLFGSILP